MAYGPKAFLRDLAIYSTGAAVGTKNSAKFVGYAARQGINLAGVGAARTVAAVPGVAAANPVAAGLGLGALALATPQGQNLLRAAEERGKSDRVRLQQAIDEYVFTTLGGQVNMPQPQQQVMPIDLQVNDPNLARGNRRDQSLIRPRPQTQHNRNVKLAMKSVKNSKFGGPKGKLNNPRATFSKVNKTISRIKKGAKVSRKGITGVIARAIKK
tara:strand:- start:254 stop:892 length:639 start_codon:yes stop_codon:yes gene_type:complete